MKALVKNKFFHTISKWALQHKLHRDQFFVEWSLQFYVFLILWIISNPRAVVIMQSRCWEINVVDTNFSSPLFNEIMWRDQQQWKNIKMWLKCTASCVIWYSTREQEMSDWQINKCYHRRHNHLRCALKSFADEWKCRHQDDMKINLELISSTNSINFCFTFKW